MGHLQSSVCRLQTPAATGAHNAGFQQVQDDMSKARSVNRDWEFVSKGTEISLGRLVSEFFTPLTLDIRTGVFSTEDTTDIYSLGLMRVPSTPTRHPIFSFLAVVRHFRTFSLNSKKRDGRVSLCRGQTHAIALRLTLNIDGTPIVSTSV